MPDSIRVRAVDGAVVFAIEPSGRVVTPLRAIGREGQSSISPKRDYEDVPDHPVIRGAIAAGSLELYEPPKAEEPVVDAVEAPAEEPAPESPADAEPSKETA